VRKDREGLQRQWLTPLSEARKDEGETSFAANKLPGL
jgi:hypothetical protein